MADKFQNKYRTPSIRQQNWDYRLSGIYFITICTKNREHYFGKIVNDSMVLSHVGVFTDILWYEIKTHTKNIELGEFVVMPNHIHGIFILNKLYKNDRIMKNVNLNGNGDDGGGGDGDNVETGHALSLQPTNPLQLPQPLPQTQSITPSQPTETISQRRFQNIGKNSVSSIIGSYKSGVTKHVRRLGLRMEWQERYYDYIIHNTDEHQRIQKYILNNPAQWQKDRF